jgi:hypothetical protein
MKKIIKKFARNFSFEISSYRPSNTAAAQLVNGLKESGINVVLEICANEG